MGNYLQQLFAEKAIWNSLLQTLLFLH